MSRSSFFSRTPSHDRDRSPLLPQHRNSVSLRDLSPRTSHSQTSNQSPRASPSPPPAFYRDDNARFDAGRALRSEDGSRGYKFGERFTDGNGEGYGRGNGRREGNGNGSGSGNGGFSQSLSPSPSRTKDRRTRIQFMQPPPPIAQSVLLPGQYPALRGGGVGAGGEDGLRHPDPITSHAHFGRRSSAAVVLDPLLVLERRERAIMQDLQLLLDAQSTGLLHGFGGGGGEADSDAGSNTPTSRSAGGGRRGSGSDAQGRSGRYKGGIVPVRQPKGRTIGLRSARRGLLREMEELAAVKDEEMAILDGEVVRRERVLQKAGSWEKRIEIAKAQISGVATGDDNGEEDREISELQNEEKAVDNEIREMEDRLAAMKARKRWLGERIKEGVNRREARLSSYHGALREAEREVKEFLRRPPIPTSAIMGDEEGFSALPAGRRTLEMAKDWWSREVEKLNSRKAEVDTEKRALEEGARLWSESVTTVVQFEDDLRKQMRDSRPEDVQGAGNLKKQISKMAVAIESLENTCRIAEERGWNLLICAVGAELEAFRQGGEILKNALNMMPGEEHEQDGNHGSGGAGNDESGEESRNPRRTNGLLDEEELQSSQMTRYESMESEHAHTNADADAEREESEDDGPDLAALMVDHGVRDDTP